MHFAYFVCKVLQLLPRKEKVYLVVFVQRTKLWQQHRQEEIVSYALHARRSIKTERWRYPVAVITTLLWIVTHYIFVLQWSLGKPEFLWGIVALIAILMVVFFGIDDAVLLGFETVGDALFIMGLVFVLGLIAGWLMSNPGFWRLLGSVLVGLENYIVTGQLHEQHAQGRRGISMLAFGPIVFLGLLGIAEAMSPFIPVLVG